MTVTVTTPPPLPLEDILPVHSSSARAFPPQPGLPRTHWLYRFPNGFGASVIQGEESGAVHVTANLRREGFSQVFSFTALAGGNLVVAFDTSIGHPFIAVVLGSTQSGRFTDMQTLVDATMKYATTTGN